MKEDKLRRRDELRKKNKKRTPILPIIVTAILAVAIAALSYFYYATTPVDKSDNNDITIEIKDNYTGSEVATELKNKGLIRSEFVFKAYSRLKPELSYYVGQFNLKKSMNLPQILQQLGNRDNAQSSQKKFTIIEGDSILKIADKLQNTNISSEEFIEKTNDADFIRRLQQQFPNLITDEIYGADIKYALEGYLFPAAYNLDDNETAESLITKMVKATNDTVVPLYNKNSKVWNINGVDTDISIHKYITMASILEKESTKTDENKIIASVFLNRLAQGMKLQTDPSANYAADNLNGAPTAEDLALNSPYNTYVVEGLPPGPISTVGTVSYEALNNPDNTDYLYFLHDSKDGKAYFSRTYDEHERLAMEHIEGYIPSGTAQ